LGLRRPLKHTTVLLCGLELYEVNAVENRTKHFRTYLIISCLCALSVASHLSFAFVNVSLLVVFFTWSCLIRGSLRRKHFALKNVCYDLMSLSVPGALIFLSLNPAIIQFDNTELYYGNQNWSQVYSSIITAVFDDFAKKDLWTIRSESVTWVVYRLPFFLALCILFGGIFALKSLLKSYTGKSTIDGNQKLWLFVFAIVAVTITLHSSAYMLFGVLLPIERYGIYFVPLSMLLAAISIGTFRGRHLQLIFRYFGRISLLLVVMYFLSSFHMNYFRNWKYDSGTKDVFLMLRSLNGDYSNGIGILWWYEPSLNFYRTYYNESSIPPFTREKPNIKQAYFILLPDVDEDRRFIQDHNIKIIFQHPVSRAIVGIKE